MTHPLKLITETCSACGEAFSFRDRHPMAYPSFCPVCTAILFPLDMDRLAFPPVVAPRSEEV